MAGELTCGIIGCGVIAPAHIQGYQAIPGVRVTWACDLIEEKARQRAAEYGIAHVTRDYREVLGNVDCISVCTDHGSHAKITADALRAGTHVLCEKALAATPAGLRMMFEAHARYPYPIFAAVFQHRFDAEIRYLKELVNEGAFGTILTAGMQMRCLRTEEYYRADKWRGTWDKEGGAVLINQAIHFIDALAWIMGGIEAVQGTYTNLTHNGVIEAEDTAVAMVRFRCGALGTIEATCSSNIDWEPTIAIHGSRGAVELRHGKPTKIEFENEEVAARVRDGFAACAVPSSVRSAIRSYYGEGHSAQIADFVDAVRHHREPFVTARSARHAVEVVFGIYESHRTRKWVEITSAV
ncbi:MAG: Gfo/Idh/MocA family oxidoreductase [bacterium]|nr:Gfo/Idh/MocA family oxidoreductase [bacterium]